MRLVGLFLFLFFSGISLAEKPLVMVLQSYHQGYAWTDALQEALMEELSADFRVRTVYLNALEGSVPVQEQIKKAIFSQFEQMKPERVVACDDAALDLGMELLKSYPQTRLVFLGVNRVKAALSIADPRVSGISVQVDLQSNLELIQTLFPDTRHLIGIVDDTLTGKGNAETFLNLKELVPEWELELWTSLSREEMASRLNRLEPSRTALIYLRWMRLPGGEVLGLDESVNWILNHTVAPMFTFWDVLLCQDMVGGYITTAREQARTAVAMLKSRGGRIISLSGKGVVRYSGLQRHGLEFRRFGEQIRVLGQPGTGDGWFQKFLALLGAFGLQTLLILGLAGAYIRLRSMKDSLIQTQEQLNRILSGLECCVYSLDPKTLELLFVSESSDVLIGVPAAELMQSRNLHRSLPILDSREEISASILRAVESKESSRLVYRVSLQGREHWILDRITLRVDSQGRQVLNGIITDITTQQSLAEKARQMESEAKHSDERLRLAVDAAQAGIWDWDVEHDQVFWDEGLSAILGRSPAPMYGRLADWQATFHPGDQDTVMGEFRKILETRTEHFSLSYRLIREGGDSLWVRCTGRAHYHADGVPSRLVGVIMDISDQRRIEEELRESLNRQQHLAEEAGVNVDTRHRLMTVLGREIRTPIQGIMNMVDLLDGTSLSEHQKSILRTIGHSAGILDSLTGDFQIQTASDQEDEEVESVRVNFMELLDQVIDQHGAQIARKGLNFYLVLGRDVPEFLRSSPKLLRQLLINLLSNAIRVTQQGHILIRIHAVVGPAGDLSLRLEVEDTGPGIPEDKKRLVFEPFYRLEGEGHQGLAGLGLSICRSIVQRLGGQIGVEKPEEGGACFWVELGFPAWPENRPARPFQGEKIQLLSQSEQAQEAGKSILAWMGLTVDSFQLEESSALEPEEPTIVILNEMKDPKGILEFLKQRGLLHPKVVVVVSLGTVTSIRSTQEFTGLHLVCHPPSVPSLQRALGWLH